MLTRAGFRADVRGYAGALLADIPKVGHHFDSRPSRLYELAQRLAPNLLGRRIYAVAVKL